MELRVLGCSGGIGAGLKTTSFLIDGEILIDAGSGVGTLTLDEMVRIKHIFLTHSHLDHVHSIPLLVDSIFDRIKEPIIIHALPETIQALQEHVFNWVIWPDFSRLPHPDTPVLRFAPSAAGSVMQVGDLRFESIPVNHVVPTVGYRVSNAEKAFAFSGDTTTNDSFWDAINAHESLDLLLVEAAFSNDERELCRQARHYCPEFLAADLVKLKHKPKIYLSHAKPGEEEKIYRECRDLVTGHTLNHLSSGKVFKL